MARFKEYEEKLPLENPAKTPTAEGFTVTATSGNKLGTVTINPVPIDEVSASDITPTKNTQTIAPISGTWFDSITVNPVPAETTTITPITSSQTITPSEGSWFESVTVNAAIAENVDDPIEMAKRLRNPNAGKVFRYTGDNAEGYIKNDFYEVVKVGIGVEYKQYYGNSQSKPATENKVTVTPDVGYLLDSVYVNIPEYDWE